MQIKILEDSLKMNVRGKLRPFIKDDIVTVDNDIGELACKYGWAEDIDSVIVTGNRVPGSNGPIKPGNVKMSVS